jgi:hypothetical protein
MMRKTTRAGVGFAVWLLLLSAAPAGAQGLQDMAPPPPAPAVLGNPDVPPPPQLVLPGLPVEQAPVPARIPDLGPPPELFAPTDRGFGDMGGMFSPVVGNMVPRADYRFAWFPSEGVRGQATELGYMQHDVSLIVPLWQTNVDALSVSAHVRAEFFTTKAVLVDTMQPFPDELWNVHFNATYRRLFDNGWIAGGGVSFGSASDKPFHSIHEMTAGVNAFLRIPSGEHNAWLFTLSYSPTSELAFPIPGVAYLWQPSPDFRAFIGLPFSLMWRPIEDLTLDLSYMLVRTVHARATYRLCKPARVYVAFDWSNEAYFLADRPNENDRFFYYDKRLSAGVLLNLCPAAWVDLSAGYVFDRFYFEGRSYNDRNFDRIDVGNGPFLAVRLGVRF